MKMSRDPMRITNIYEEDEMRYLSKQVKGWAWILISTATGLAAAVVYWYKHDSLERLLLPHPNRLYAW